MARRWTSQRSSQLGKPKPAGTLVQAALTRLVGKERETSGGGGGEVVVRMDDDGYAPPTFVPSQERATLAFLHLEPTPERVWQSLKDKIFVCLSSGIHATNGRRLGYFSFLLE
jgi:hypothetical protein